MVSPNDPTFAGCEARAQWLTENVYTDNLRNMLVCKKDELPIVQNVTRYWIADFSVFEHVLGVGVIVCVCVCVYTHICMHTHIHTCPYTCI